MDGGNELYKVFLEYQTLLYRGSIGEACRYQLEARVVRMGIGTIKLKDHGANTGERGSEGKSKGRGSQHSSCPHKISGPKEVRHRVETSVQRPDAGLACFTMMEATCLDLTESTGDVAMSSGVGCGSHSTMSSLANDVPPSIGARLPILPAAAKPSKRSTSKRGKKRKASSQNPPVITPSDASEDDKEPSQTHVVTVANATSHRSKRSTPNPCSQPHDLPGFKNRVDKKNLAHRPKTNKQHCEDTGISQPQSTLAGIRSDGFVPSPSIKGRRGAESPTNSRKDVETRVSNLTPQPTRASSNSGGLRKIKPVRDPQTRATKQLRGASMPTLDGEPGEESKSKHGLRAKVVQESITQVPLVTGPPLAQENNRVESKTRRKHTRFESETGFVASHAKASADSHEVLGPDVRLLRPLPKKVRDRRLVPIEDEDTAIRGVPCGASSLKHADRLLQDVASNALAILREGAGPDVPDWTQDEGHDAECDDLCEHDEDEADDVQVATATSAPSMVILKPPVPAPPRIWAQVGCFIASCAIAADC